LLSVEATREKAIPLHRTSDGDRRVFTDRFSCLR